MTDQNTIQIQKLLDILNRETHLIKDLIKIVSNANTTLNQISSQEIRELLNSITVSGLEQVGQALSQLPGGSIQLSPGWKYKQLQQDLFQQKSQKDQIDLICKWSQGLDDSVKDPHPEKTLYYYFNASWRGWIFRFKKTKVHNGRKKSDSNYQK